jgi:hypothetical protein
MVAGTILKFIQFFNPKPNPNLKLKVKPKLKMTTKRERDIVVIDLTDSDDDDEPLVKKQVIAQYDETPELTSSQKARALRNYSRIAFFQHDQKGCRHPVYRATPCWLKE